MLRRSRAPIRVLFLALSLACASCATPVPFEDVALDAGPSRLYPAPYERVKLAARGVVSGLEFSARELEEPAPGTAIVIGSRTTPARGDTEDVRLTVGSRGAQETSVHCLVQGRLRSGGQEDRSGVYCPLILYQFELFLGL